MHEKQFEMPSDIIEAGKAGRLVLFAGAGISTENKRCYPWSFYEEIKQQMDMSDSEQITFPQLMTKFSERPNGRRELIRRIKKRFDYVESFPELYREATRFHKELSSIYLIRDIITTNWDDYFERECGATPFTSAEDFVFWDLPDRRILKIHGSIHNYGSLIITEEDYQKCYKNLNKGLLGGFLKTLLATKVILFIGYSFGDEDFNRIQKYLSREMQGLIPHAYVVTIDETARGKFEAMNMTPIVTDGTYFIRKLKETLTEDGLLIPDSTFWMAEAFLEAVGEIHRKIAEINLRKYPEVMFTLSYQDGLVHALERVKAMRHTGEYAHSCDIVRVIQAYKDKRKIHLKKRLYFNVAYIDGYMDGLMFLLVDEDQRRQASPFYLFGYREYISDFREYRKIINSGEVYHKSARNYAEYKVQNWSKGMTVHHNPFLG
jgi:hypothetical protein